MLKQVNSQSNASDWNVDDFRAEIKRQSKELKTNPAPTRKKLNVMIKEAQAVLLHAPLSLKPKIEEHLHLCHLTHDYM